MIRTITIPFFVECSDFEFYSDKTEFYPCDRCSELTFITELGLTEKNELYCSKCFDEYNRGLYRNLRGNK